MTLIPLDKCPGCDGSRLRRVKSKEPSMVGGEQDWYCSDCHRVVADAGRIE